MTFDEFINEWRSDASDIEARTSGSTGEPKLIRLSKTFVRRSAERTNAFFSITSGSRLHSCVAADFIGGKMMAVRSDIAGCRFSHELPSNQPLGSVGKGEVIDLLAVVPSQMLHILDHLEDMPDLRGIIIGGSAIDDRLREKIMSSGLNAFETYGMTETASHIALRSVGEGEWFHALDGIHVSLDGRGCLVIEFDSGERVVTNDLATLQDSCSFKIDGRIDHVIITGGKKLNPFEVEKLLSGLIEAPFIITSVPDEKWGRRVVLRIEGEPAIQEKELRREMKCILPSWKVPKDIEWVEHLERTKNGKLVR